MQRFIDKRMLLSGSGRGIGAALSQPIILDLAEADAARTPASLSKTNFSKYRTKTANRFICGIR
jgi:hypothetical protein